MTDTTTMIKALRVLSQDIQSNDGVANACVSDAAAMIESMSAQLAKANERLNNPQGLQELVCLEQMKDIPLLEIHRAHQKLHGESARLKERVAELEKHNKRLLDCVIASGDRELNGKSLNKFAIEQKQAAINSIKDKWIKKASEMPIGLECRSKGSSCYNWAMYYARELTDEVEQLRKEQDSE